MARPSSYHPDVARPARLLCALGADKAALARAFAVSPATFYRWLGRYPALAQAVAAGTAAARNPDARSSYRRATGFNTRVVRSLTPRRGRAGRHRL